MLYLATSPYQPEVAAALRRFKIGLMCQPGNGNKAQAGWLWAADNGCFSDRWDADKWLRWLGGSHPRSGCLFAVCPDVVGDAVLTMHRWYRYSSEIRRLRYPVAYVAQDLADDDLVAWDADCLFIGGSTEFKMSDIAFRLAIKARRRGMWVHVGRVNSFRRYKAWAPYADSCDGTFLAFGPATNFPKLMAWIERHDANPQLEIVQ